MKTKRGLFESSVKEILGRNSKDIGLTAIFLQTGMF